MGDETTIDVRTPTAIAADLKALRDESSMMFVPMNMQRALDLMIEFADVTAAALDSTADAVANALAKS